MGSDIHYSKLSRFTQTLHLGTSRLTRTHELYPPRAATLIRSGAGSTHAGWRIMPTQSRVTCPDPHQHRGIVQWQPGTCELPGLRQLSLHLIVSALAAW